EDPLRWLMSSDVCKHCTHAACLDVCPTGALFRTEFDTVVVQQDVCNGCGYCVPACPFGVLDKRHLPRSPGDAPLALPLLGKKEEDRKSTRLNSSHSQISYAVFCLKKKSARKRVRDAQSA